MHCRVNLRALQRSRTLHAQKGENSCRKTRQVEVPEDAAPVRVALQQILQPRRQVLALPEGQSQAVSRHVCFTLVLHAQALRVQWRDPEVALVAVRLDQVQAGAVEDIIVEVLDWEHLLVLAWQKYSIFAAQLFADGILSRVEHLGDLNGDEELFIWQWLSAVRLRYLVQK